MLYQALCCIQVLDKEQETAQLLNMCNEAVNKLERAGISL